MHDQRVGGRDVEAGLDDRGREQHVVFAVVERRHDVFQLVGGICPCATATRASGTFWSR
jgi:hypothetical protein